MNRYFTFLALSLLVSVGAFTQPCVPLISPANQATNVKLIYDDSTEVAGIQDVNGFPIWTNGVRVSWRVTKKNEDQNIDAIFFYEKAGDNQYKQITLPSNVFAGAPSNQINDSTFVVPFEYGTSYKWFVKDNLKACANATDTFEATTQPAPPYCKPFTSSESFQWQLSHITLKGEQGTSLDRGLPRRGFNYFPSDTLKVRAGYTYPGVLQYFGANYSWSTWIDYDNNGYFETSEKVSSNLYLGNPEPRYPDPIYAIHIPASSVPGIHRIRHIMGVNPEPCSGLPVGASVIDFYVNVLPFDNLPGHLGIDDGARPQGNQQPVLTIGAASHNLTEWVQIVAQEGGILAAMKAKNNDPGIITPFFIQNTGPVRTLPFGSGEFILDRIFDFYCQFPTPVPVDVRFYFSQIDLDKLMAADPTLTGIESLRICKRVDNLQFFAQSESGKVDSFYYVQFTDPQFNSSSSVEYYILGKEPVAPVTFLNLYAQRFEKNVRVSWQTVSEWGSDGFEVQHSVNGIDFKQISYTPTKAINGNSNQLLNYTFTDNQIGLAQGYYRIRQIDKDGRSTMSAVVFVKAGSSRNIGLLAMYPNPAKNWVTVDLAVSAPAKVSFEISDVTGKIVKKQNALLFTGSSKVTIPFNEIPSGTYLLIIKDAEGNSCVHKKLVKY